jgi:starch synthase
MRTVLTIHNLGYQGLFAQDEFEKRADRKVFNPQELEFYGRSTCLKRVVYADIVNTVSPTYSREILGQELGLA